jgi:hypothetical protein
MKEQKKTTELVEQETTEEIIVCNGCGEEVENSKEFYTVGSSIVLHFCQKCLPNEDSQSLTGKLAYKAPTVPPEKEHNAVYVAMAASGGIYALLSGLVTPSSVVFSLIGFGLTLFVVLILSTPIIALID